LYQGSARDYKAVIEISKDFPLVLSASQRTEQQLISRFKPTEFSVFLEMLFWTIDSPDAS